MEGKTILITGGNAGLGRRSAEDLAALKARVIIACRSEEKGLAAVEEIIAATSNSNVKFMKLDLASFASVRSFAKEFLASESRLDVLINNAGIFRCKEAGKVTTEDGYEYVMQTNHLGHFLLTKLLLDLIKKSAPARIVVVSSDAHKMVRNLDMDNLNCEKSFDGHMYNYSKSKLANVLFAKELSRQLKGTGVTVNSLHPGAIPTKILTENGSMFEKTIAFVLKPFTKTIADGAATTNFVATDPSLADVTGEYFANVKKATASPLGQNEDLAKRFWEASEKMIA